MENNIINTGEEIELEIQERDCESESCCSAAEIDAINIHRLTCAYSSPFMPMIDLSFAFEGLIRLFKKCRMAKKKDARQWEKNV